MGLFDTVYFDPPLNVPGWADPVSETQTKHFGSSMQSYWVGSLMSETPVLLGIVEEFLWCSPKGDEPGRTHTVYFVIWHRILAGVYLDLEEAEQRLRTVDRLDLIEWLDEAQKLGREWQDRFQSFLRDVSALRAHQTEDAPKSEKEAAFWQLINHLPDEVLESSDPLGAIFEIHAKERAKSSIR